MRTHRRTRVAVVVLGDIGRSPRMQYHARALADAGADVELIGLAGTDPFPLVRDHAAICLRPLGPAGRTGDGTDSAAAAPSALLALRRGGRLLAALRAVEHLDAVLVQVPPAIPTLAATWLATRGRRTRLVLDWHNLGHAVLGLRLGDRHPAVRLSAVYERVLGRRADAHLCVSTAMQRALAARWGITATVLRDRPAAQFTPLAPDARAEAARVLCERAGVPPPPGTALVVSPTSWTEDDDFPLLLEALPRLEAALAARNGPRVLVLLTGTGPLRAHFAPRLEAHGGPRLRVRSLWLAPAEYPALLPGADLGLSLHRSASGLDLPMKIVDLFGAGVPVCALDYGSCLGELVRPGENAVLFRSAAELADAVAALVGGLPDDPGPLDRLRRNTLTCATRWDEEWRHAARDVVLPELP